MAKSQDAKRNVKKEAAWSPKEKKAAKLAKKASRTSYNISNRLKKPLLSEWFFNVNPLPLYH
ncbi:hypothetical protein [Winogradskyella sp. Asnod2-B02-A]|uniref:hypothetical protein n=1 Tax=Winogradskyella sp. Asnod2-B02-A TaxID=3160583 RepID=UPI003864E33B